MVVDLPDRTMGEGRYSGLLLRLSGPAGMHVEDTAELQIEAGAAGSQDLVPGRWKAMHQSIVFYRILERD